MWKCAGIPTSLMDCLETSYTWTALGTQNYAFSALLLVYSKKSTFYKKHSLV